MAIITKIRERSGLAVGIVALGLVLFIVGGDLLSPNSLLMGGRNTTVGKINGKKVDYKELQAMIEKQKQSYFINTGNAPDENAMQGIREQAWQQLIFKYAFKKEFDKIGIKVTDDEIFDMVQGNYIHPAVRQAFTNPETGEFNKAAIQNFLRNIKQMEPRQQAAWLNFEQQLPDDRMRTKYENLFTSTVYATVAEAQREYETQMRKADVSFLFIPFNSIADSTIAVTDAELNAYLQKNKARYQTEATAVIDYVVFDVVPSKEDSAFVKEELARLKEGFAAAQDDTAFAKMYSEGENNLDFRSVESLPEPLAKMANELQAKQVYGPFFDGADAVLYKIAEINNNGEPVLRASHILFRNNEGTDEGKARAKKQAQNVLKEIQAGASFAEMAKKYGTDGTAPRGGDLGFFGKGRMVSAFENACFSATKTGVLPNVIETEFGFHLIDITAMPTNRQFKVVEIRKSVLAGQQTIEEVYRKADEFAATVKNQADFDQKLTEPEYANLKKQTAVRLSKQQNSVNDLTDAREIIRWAFNDANVGEVSKVFDARDKYVIAVLKNKVEKGTSPLEDVREPVTQQVRKDKKAQQIIEKLKGITATDFAAIAQAYGADAKTGTAPGLTANSNFMPEVGYDPETVAKAVFLKEGQKTAPFKGENGVVILTATKVEAAAEIADYSLYKKQIEDRRKGRAANAVNEAVKEIVTVEDNRIKFF